MIARRLENLLALDYPADRLEIVVASDASDDGTDEIVEEFAAREPRVRLLRCPRGGKVAAQNRAVARVAGRRRRLLGRELHLGARCAAPARPRRSPTRTSPTSAAGSCSRRPTGRTSRARTGGWRRGCASRRPRPGSITGGNGSIYAVRRADYVDVDPRFGHDLSFPYLMVQHGRRAAYEPGGARVREAVARHRGRVRAQGADVRALLGDRRRGRHAPAACRPGTWRRSSRTGICATAAASRTSSCSARASRSPAAAAIYRAALARRSSPSSAPRPRGPACRATTRSSPGRPRRRFGTTSARACRPCGRRPRARGEPGRRRRGRRLRARRRGAGARHRRGCRQARGRRARALPTAARGQGRRRVRAAQAADDGRRRGDEGRGRGRGRGRSAHHAAPARCCAGSRSTSCRSSGTWSAAR